MSKYASPYLENKIELKHDLIAGHVLKIFLEFENFKSGHISYEDLSVNPDAVIYAVRNNREYSLGVEVELHQKSQRRVIKKFAKYYDSQIFNYIIYVMPKEAIFHSYKKIILSLKSFFAKKQKVLRRSLLESVPHTCQTCARRCHSRLAVAGFYF